MSKNRQPSKKIFDFDWLIALLYSLRPDLHALFRKNDKAALALVKWLLFAGRKECRIFSESPYLKNILSRPLKPLNVTPLEALIYHERPDVQKAFPLPAKLDDFKSWFYKHGVDEHKVLDLLNEDDLLHYQKHHPEIFPIKEEDISKTYDADARPYGVNLIGHAFGQLGIGEDLRMTAKALQIAQIPFTIIDFPPGPGIPQNDMSMAEYVGKEAPYAFNIICLTALETGRLYAERGSSLFEDHFNIGYWPWELAKWPTAWKQLIPLVDEIWVSSRHIYDAVSPISIVPTLIMPLAVDISSISSLKRADFSLPEDAYLFCFSFDLNSSIYRKNPMACIRAFQKAFPATLQLDKPVGLIIKCHSPARQDKNWTGLKELAREDPRIHIIEKTLAREDLLALYSCCDCYMSLHRAEGFGRGIAEALLLGLDVIATDYSGNVDFCRENPAAHMASYNMVPVKDGEYPFGDGQLWANVNEDHVAELMRECHSKPGSGIKQIKKVVDPRMAARRYSDRLKIIWKEFSRKP